MVEAAGRLREGQSRWQQLRAATTHVFYMPYMSISGVARVRAMQREIMAAATQDAGCRYFNLTDAVPADARNFADSTHFTDAGSRLFGEAVAEAIRRSHPWD